MAVTQQKTQPKKGSKNRRKPIDVVIIKSGQGGVWNTNQPAPRSTIDYKNTKPEDLWVYSSDPRKCFFHKDIFKKPRDEMKYLTKYLLAKRLPLWIVLSKWITT